MPANDAAARPEAPPLAVLALGAAPFRPLARRIVVASPPPLPGTWRRRRGSGSRGDAGADAGSRGGAGSPRAGRPFVVGDRPAPGPGSADGAGEGE